MPTRAIRTISSSISTMEVDSSTDHQRHQGSVRNRDTSVFRKRGSHRLGWSVVDGKPVIIIRDSDDLRVP